MKRLALTRSMAGGEFSVWRMPEPGVQYIASCDPSRGREWSEDGDHSSIGLWKRHPGRIIEEVANWYGRWTIHNVGIVLAQLSRAYGDEPVLGREKNCAIINIERNIMDAAKFSMTEIQGFDPAFFFIPRDKRSIKDGDQQTYFTNKDSLNEHYLWNTLQDYMDRKALILRDRATRSELMALSRKRNGAVDSNGKDRSVMVIMACVADQEMPAVVAERKEEEQASVKVAGMFRLPEKVKKSGLGHRSIWGAQG